MADLIEVIERKRRKALKLSQVLFNCSNTEAGRLLRRELMIDRDKVYCDIGRLCSNSGVKICLQSEYTS